MLKDSRIPVVRRRGSELNTMNLSAELANYGINGRSRSVRWLRGKATPEQLDYLDLIEPANADPHSPVMPDGVAESQERPLLFFVNESRLAQAPDQQQTQIKKMQRALASRGDRAYLAIVSPGTLKVAPVSLRDRKAEWKTFHAGTGAAQTFFSRLALGQCQELPAGKDVDFLFKELFQLVEQTANRLAQLNVKRTDVISLIGRALFFRFLSDRNIVKESDLKKIGAYARALQECFDTAENAEATSRWLDNIFNGDFLPLTDNGSLEFFQSIGQRSGNRVFSQLGGIIRGAKPVGDDSFQLRLPIHWGHLDFAHIPVGLLSQVYERLSWKWDDRNAKVTSVHYTPRNIAATLVGEAFDHLQDAASARVLDPACGAGVFLVIAFRRLYRELWKKNRDRPDTRAIREILEKQLVGFDISDSALKLSALSLYLTAIELDPDPAPPEKLKFQALRSGRKAILFDWRKETDKAEGPVIGSLGSHVDSRFDGTFDLVLCNPPWTNIPGRHKTISDALNSISRELVTGLDKEIGARYENPDSVPDLPFLWRSLVWCKAGGRIAMALPARTLFKQGPQALTAREAIFRLIEVTGIINCSNLRKTKVWPDMDQPFMLLFARNRRPKPGHRLHFISPQTDYSQNSLGEMRIDSKSAQLVPVEETFEEPWLWKALAVGTALDVDVVRKIKATGSKALEVYWEKDLKLTCRNGYQIRENQEQQSAEALQVLKNLNASSEFRFEVDTSKLKSFPYATAFRTRLEKEAKDPLRVYRGPLAIVNESPGPDRALGWALFCPDDVAYNESFYGYSGAGHHEGEFLVRYLQLFVHSRLWMYYALITSAKFGVERPNVDKRDLDQFPFLPLERLTLAQRTQVKELSERLIREDSSVFPEIDAFFGRAYGLSLFDIEVINDTLVVREPHDELGMRASADPTAGECAAFIRRVESILKPLFKAIGQEPVISTWAQDDLHSPFIVLMLGVKGAELDPPDALFRNAVLPLANETGATTLIKETGGGLLIGILRQYRYWTPSRARILSAEITRQHMAVFEV